MHVNYFRYSTRQVRFHPQESTIKDVTARNLGALRSIVSAFKPILCARRIVDAQTARIVKEVKREESFAKENMLMLGHLCNTGAFSLLVMFPKQLRRGKFRTYSWERHPLISQIIEHKSTIRFLVVSLLFYFFEEVRGSLSFIFLQLSLSISLFYCNAMYWGSAQSSTCNVNLRLNIVCYQETYLTSPSNSRSHLPSIPLHAAATETILGSSDSIYRCVVYYVISNLFAHRSYNILVTYLF